MFNDLRFALRMLHKNSGFTVAVVLTLAIGIGANTAIFTLIDALLLKRLPVHQPDRLVALSDPDRRGQDEPGLFSHPEYVELRDRNTVLTGLAVTDRDWVTLGWNGVTESVRAAFVSDNYFDVLGINAIFGRTFSPEDARPGNAVAVLRYDFWRDRLGGDPAVVGRTIDLSYRPFTVIGVLPPGFNGLDAGLAENVFLPMSMEKGGWNWRLFGRLKAGVSREQAQASLTVLFAHIRELIASQRVWEEQGEHQRYLERRIALLDASTGLPAGGGFDKSEQLRQRFSTPLGVLMVVVGLVLLIGCVNIANLLLARATARRREMAVRLALGVGRGRLLRQMLVESFLLTSTGGAIGVLLAWWGCEGIVNQLGMPVGAAGRTIALSATPDWRVLSFTLAISFATGCVFGLAPALQAFHIPVAAALKDEGRAAFGGSVAVRLRKGLIAAQVTLSLLLLAGGGLFIRTFWNLEHVKTGIDRAHVIFFWCDSKDEALWKSKAGQRQQVIRLILERVESIPGVRSAATENGGGFGSVAIEGRPPDPNVPKARFYIVSSRYFDTLGIPIVHGRVWTPAEDGDDPVKVAVINQTMARTFFANTNPIGRHVKANQWDLEITGVVGDAIHDDLREHAQPTIYVAAKGSGGLLYVRTVMDPAAVVSAVRREVHRDPNWFMTQALTFDGFTQERLTEERLLAWLTGTLAGMAALLAAIGLYGVIAWSVARRTQEIGIRIALGAGRGNLVWMVLRDVLTPVVVGLAIGVPAAVALAQLVRSLLYGVGPADPFTIVGAALLMCAVAAGAAYLPARRATKVDPMIALRYE